MSTAPHSIDEQALRKFGSIFLDPSAGCLECRAFKVYSKGGLIVPATGTTKKTFSGWFDDLGSLEVQAGRFRGASAYVTLNPVDPKLLSRSRNEMNPIASNTGDEDITHLRWLYIDVDPERPPDTSSTDEELKAALSRREAILGDHPEMQVSSLWGCSGNGAYIWVRLDDLPNDPKHKQWIARTLSALSGRYSDKVVKVDVKTKNPSRVGPLPGTWKTKGPNTANRPWRLVTLDTPINGREVRR